MTVIIGNARISEFGTVNGKPGDQTKKEVMTQSFSTGGKWEYDIRPKSVKDTKKLGKYKRNAIKIVKMTMCKVLRRERMR